jgi:hypothetical protein
VAWSLYSFSSYSSFAFSPRNSSIFVLKLTYIGCVRVLAGSGNSSCLYTSANMRMSWTESSKPVSIVVFTGIALKATLIPL